MQFEVNNTESTYKQQQSTKITDQDIMDNPKLELKELEGNILEGKKIVINASGIASGGLRNCRDGYSFFGYLKTKVRIIKLTCEHFFRTI